jgi:hypothetical protein
MPLSLQCRQMQPFQPLMARAPRVRHRVALSYERGNEPGRASISPISPPEDAARFLEVAPGPRLKYKAAGGFEEESYAENCEPSWLTQCLPDADPVVIVH